MVSAAFWVALILGIVVTILLSGNLIRFIVGAFFSFNMALYVMVCYIFQLTVAQVFPVMATFSFLFFGGTLYVMYKYMDDVPVLKIISFLDMATFFIFVVIL